LCYEYDFLNEQVVKIEEKKAEHLLDLTIQSTIKIEKHKK